MAHLRWECEVCGEMYEHKNLAEGCEDGHPDLTEVEITDAKFLDSNRESLLPYRIQVKVGDQETWYEISYH